MSPCTLHSTINAMDEAIGTIRKLAELGPVIDGNPHLFPNCIEVLSLIAREAGELEELSAQAASCVLPGPQRLEGTP
jgi:hypothetical protein